MHDAPDPTAPVVTGPSRLGGRLRRSHGVRAGVIVGFSTLVFSITAYMFQTACIRWLGPSRYSDIAALLALNMVIAVPLGSVQTLIARETAYLAVDGSPGMLGRFYRQTMKVAVPGAILVTVLALILTGPIESLLDIESVIVVTTGVSALVFMVLGSILYGFLQGLQRFPHLALNYLVAGLTRPVLVVPALVLGLGSAGALSANTAAMAVVVGLAVWSLRDLYRHTPAPEPVSGAFGRREVAVLVIGSLAFASLTNLDIVLARYYLDAEQAGIYAAAALVGKMVLLLPGAVVTVLLPKAASRAAAGTGSRRILRLSAGVTGGLSLLGALVLALLPESLLVWAFGPAFRDSTALLGWFGLAMTAAALVNVYLSVYLAHRDLAFPLLVGVAAIAQIVVIALWHPDPRSIVLTTLGCCLAIVAVHELAFPHRLLRPSRHRQPEHIAQDPG